ncbi:mechanosensitive ion channel family protein [Methylacidiphilum caldifontis]|uniref:Mechanosensitive ion channel protein MscS n=1 Tax=Methylacidiphilum caldifontis TaxID=2795386 RepID=A0A4Y8PGT4_9BACT|nr:mechanosensitive ion channel domain-containing protein [Methylacidiphilum caldifontis]TFE71258.1 mechanosensitive ion channel protein MscS [Methylacidiphilum caldifontis]
MLGFNYSLLYPVAQFGLILLAFALLYFLSRPFSSWVEKKLKIGDVSKPLNLLKVLFSSFWSPFWIAFLFSLSIIGAIFLTLFVEEKFSLTLSFIELFWGLSIVWYVAFFVFLFRLSKANLAFVKNKFGNDQQFWNIIIGRLARVIYVVIPVIGVAGAIEIYPFHSEIRRMLNKTLEILLIVLLSYVFFELVSVSGEFIIYKWRKAENDFTRRKVYTQVKVIERILYFFIILFAVSSILMLFPEVKHIGASMLASAGVLGIIVGFAAQHIFSNIFAGIQLAITQPIRLGDVVVVQGYWGTIEEITLTYVVVHIWDHRRLVLPISYFTSNLFENWTRHSSELLGTVHIYVDYSIPVDFLRAHLKQILSDCPLWDKKVAVIQVTHATDKAMELRCLVSAENSSKLWDLRCFVREKIIDYLRQNYPQSLPKYRLDFVNEKGFKESSLSALSKD